MMFLAQTSWGSGWIVPPRNGLVLSSSSLLMLMSEWVVTSPRVSLLSDQRVAPCSVGVTSHLAAVGPFCCELAPAPLGRARRIVPQGLASTPGVGRGGARCQGSGETVPFSWVGPVDTRPGRGLSPAWWAVANRWDPILIFVCDVVYLANPRRLSIFYEWLGVPLILSPIFILNKEFKNII